jgi:hypothetical protein
LLQPGAAIGAVLMTGDADIEAIGTASYRQAIVCWHSATHF